MNYLSPERGQLQPNQDFVPIVHAPSMHCLTANLLWHPRNSGFLVQQCKSVCECKKKQDSWVGYGVTSQCNLRLLVELCVPVVSEAHCLLMDFISFIDWKPSTSAKRHSIVVIYSTSNRGTWIDSNSTEQDLRVRSFLSYMVGPLCKFKHGLHYCQHCGRGLSG